jgi:hypothetical protein
VIGAGELLDVGMWSRTWPNCADGSCSGVSFVLEGAFGDGEPFQAFLGGSLIVSATGSLQSAPPSCPGQGEKASVTKCGDEADPTTCVVVSENREDDPERPVGLVFRSERHEPRPVLVSISTEISVSTTARTIEEQSTGEDSGRLWETLTLPRGAVSEGQEVTVTAMFALGLAGSPDDFEITEIVVGSKYQPESEIKDQDSTSFIGVVRTEISTSPYMELTTQYQGGAWAVAVDSDDVVGLELTGYDFRTSDGGITAEFSFLAPEWEIDRVHISHDLRAYSWDAFEDDCTDLSDNDNDGVVDCDDEDCDGHPACDGDDDDSAGDDDDSADAADDDDDAVGDDDDDSAASEQAGCGCSVASGGLPALLLAMALPSLVLLRRRRLFARS